jgi:hypothetical protein
VDDDRNAIKSYGNLYQLFFFAQQFSGRGPQIRGPMGGGIDASAGTASLHIDSGLGVTVHIDFR